MVKKQRILGLTFDERLNWKEHIKDVKAQFTEKLVSYIMGLEPENTLGSTK
jgi:hypothetical protein